MALILSLETSGESCSVALHNQGTVVAHQHINEPQAHAVRLASLIQQVFTDASVKISQLKAVAISAGPGSYTGLRIGTSTAKGICYSLGIPLIAVNTLELLVHQATVNKHEADIYCPMIDARRMEVYCLTANKEGHILTPTEAKILDENSFSEQLSNHTMLFFGSGAAKCRSVLKHQNAIINDSILPSALQLGTIAWQRFEKRQFEDLVYFEPFYLKEFQVKKSTKPLY
jgi:tRNA threonylcarbamoyladenosine biosynthesis protein TsaB